MLEIIFAPSYALVVRFDSAPESFYHCPITSRIIYSLALHLNTVVVFLVEVSIVDIAGIFQIPSAVFTFPRLFAIAVFLLVPVCGPTEFLPGHG